MNNTLKENVAGLIVLLLIFLLPLNVLGATVSLDAERVELGVSSEFEITVSLDPEKISLNAISGRILFDEEVLELKEIKDGNSAVNFWVERPSLQDRGEIVFSGITPLGFGQSKNFVFSMIFIARGHGEGKVWFEDLELLKNDGEGSVISVKKPAINFSIKTNLEPISIEEESTDVEPSEEFKPELGRDPEIFDGQYFLVFAAEDKGEGVLFYEIKEGWFGSFVKAQSPYLIKDQSLRKDIYVKAVDRSYNERIVKFKSKLAWYKDYYILGIIGLLVLALLFLRKKWKRRYTNY